MDVTFFLTLMPQSSSDFGRRKSGAAPGRPPSPAALLSFPSSPLPSPYALAPFHSPAMQVPSGFSTSSATQLGWLGKQRNVQNAEEKVFHLRDPCWGCSENAGLSSGPAPKERAWRRNPGSKEPPEPKKAFSVCAYPSVSRHFCYILCLPVCLCQ